MSDANLDALLTRARAYTTHSHTAHTLQNDAANWKHFIAWCAEHGGRSLPAAPETILRYVVALIDRYAVSTIERRLASISYYHKQARHPLPITDPGAVVADRQMTMSAWVEHHRATQLRAGH